MFIGCMGCVFFLGPTFPSWHSSIGSVTSTRVVFLFRNSYQSIIRVLALEAEITGAKSLEYCVNGVYAPFCLGLCNLVNARQFLIHQSFLFITFVKGIANRLQHR